MSRTHYMGRAMPPGVPGVSAPSRGRGSNRARRPSRRVRRSIIWPVDYLSDFFTLLLPDTAARLANHRTNPAIAKAKRLFWCKSADLIVICRFRIVSLAVSDFFALQARF